MSAAQGMEPSDPPGGVALSVVIPAYAEGARIAETLRVTAAELARLGCAYEVLVVDDGSPDDTCARAEAAAAALSRPGGAVRAVRYQANGGKGYALKFGAARTAGAFVAFLDADLDLHPRLLARLMAVQRAQAADLVIGSKRHPASVLEYPAERRLYSAVYARLIRLLFGLPVRDTQTGIKLLRGSFARGVLPRLHVNHFAFDLEMLVVAHRLGLRLAEAPIELTFRRYTGRVGPRQILRIMRDTAAIWWRLHRDPPAPLRDPDDRAGPPTLAGLPEGE